MAATTSLRAGLRAAGHGATSSSSSRLAITRGYHRLRHVPSNPLVRARNEAPTSRQSLSIRLTVRTYSSEAPKEEKEKLSPALQASYDRLRPVIETFEAPIDWAVAYGSGVMKQAQAKDGEPPPMIDFLMATPSSEKFHDVNIRQNPSHYPLYARVLGGSFVAWIQESFGAEVWYVTMVEVNGLSIKYGVISTSALVRDLEAWTTFYLSGRLQKVTLPLQSPSSLDHPIHEALQHNLQSALSTSLLLLPERFGEDELWESITGLSYSGDLRMNVPGAENPEKVKNIVRGQGARDGFRRMYEPFFDQLGVSFEGGKGGKGTWDNGKVELAQSNDDEHKVALASRLPIHLRRGLITRFPSLTTRSKSEEPDNQAWVEAVRHPQFHAALSEELRKIIGPPALRQSVKGLFTAGPVKSFWYSLEKVKKWFKGRKGAK